MIEEKKINTYHCDRCSKQARDSNMTPTVPDGWISYWITTKGQGVSRIYHLCSDCAGVLVQWVRGDIKMKKVKKYD